jgi:outer membrane protein OmpA-like peptidoglycan-associated protein
MIYQKEDKYLSSFFFRSIYSKTIEMIKQNWNINEDEKNRILNLHESATKRMYLSEQNELEPTPYYEIDGTGLKFKVREGKLYYAILDKVNGMVIPKIYMNGNVADFKVNPKTFELLPNKGFENSIAITDDFWPDIEAAPNAKPQNYNNVDFKFIALLPNLRPIGTPRDKKMIGRPIVYTASILEEDIEILESFGLTKSEDGSISPLTYVKRDGNGVYVKLYPSAGHTSYYSGEPDPTPDPIPFELNIESPFKFDSVSLTPEAQIEFDKFIQSINTNYANATGDVQVISSASIDGDPEGKVASGKTRKVYDMELSKKRAEAIVLTLKNNLPDIKLNFIPKGIGQTEQFARGKKYPEVKDVNQTAPNRRLIIKLPQIMKQQQ